MWIKIKNALRIAVVLSILFIFVFPIVWMLLTSVRPSEEMIRGVPSLLPHEVQFDSYIKVLKDGEILSYFMNSLISTFLILILQLSTGILAAYGFALMQSRYKNVLFVFVLGAMMIPEQVTFIPLYVAFSEMHLTNTFWGLILPELVSPFCIYMLKNAFESTNRDVVEIGIMDGMSRLAVLREVYCSENRFSIITVSLILFINNWNSYFWPKIIANTSARRVLTVGIAHIKKTYGGDTIANYNEIMAATFISVIPSIIVFCAYQYYTAKTVKKSRR